MKLPDLVGLAVGTLILGTTTSPAAEPARVGAPAPGFTLPAVDGAKYTLADYQGKFVVLEWVNFDCPFVRKHYRSGNIPSLQRTYTEEGVVWLSICSSAPGKQGYFTHDDLKARMAREKAAPTAYLIDQNGTVGHAYGAKTTPHMFIIDPDGVVIYAGGIDNIASTNVDDLEKATNYVKTTLDAALNGREIPVSASAPYGCSVKYK